MRLKGRTAIVTGAGRGIGLAIALKFLKEGAQVLLVDNVEERLERALPQARALGSAYPCVADVRFGSDCRRTVDQALHHFGRVDILANNAGIAHFAPFLEVEEDDWDRVIDVDLKGVFLMGQAVARQMVAQGTGGAIVNMASTNGLVGERGLAAYNAAKAGVNLLTKTMAIELAEHNIRVNAVCPGFIPTELVLESGGEESFIREYINKIPLRRYGKPEEVADLYAYLASDEASFITGASIVIDGGQLAEQ